MIINNYIRLFYSMAAPVLLAIACQNNQGSDALHLIDSANRKDSSENDIMKQHACLTLPESISSGSSDTFRIDQASFRLCLDTAVDSHENISLEKREDNGWRKLFYVFITSDGYSLTDINLDGLDDFVSFYHGRLYIHFFDPHTGSLDETVWVMPEDHTLLLRQPLLFCNYYGLWGNYRYTQLYTYKNHRPYYLYELGFVDSGAKANTEMELYRFRNGKIDTYDHVRNIRLSGTLQSEYVNFWRRNYKLLLKEMTK